jgi:glucan phosphoethanolaminetransferase (alkaline phosphatase superfamily)
LEVLVRPIHHFATHPRALGHLFASIAILYLLATAKLAAWARAAVALALASIVAAQLAYFRYYHAALDEQVLVAVARSWGDVKPMIVGALTEIIPVLLALTLVEYTCLSAAPQQPRGARWPALAVVCLGIASGGGLQSGTLELRLAGALPRLASSAEAPRRSPRPQLAPLDSRKTTVPNVLFLLTESVRASDWCGDPAAPCEISPRLHALLPRRVPLLQMRSTSSYTAISLSVLLTGLTQSGSRERIAAVPDLFDYVRATRQAERRVSVHYWSAQSPTIFERTDIEEAVDTYLTADTMMGHPIEDVEQATEAGLDRRLANECGSRFPNLASPYVAFVHFSGTHAPYFFDQADARFVPFQRYPSWAGVDKMHRAYRNAIFEQDQSLTRCIQAFLDAQNGGPFVIVFTSDHGEAFGEHWALHHGQNLYDEQTHVPAFVAHGGGALSLDEEIALAKASETFVTHFDVLPTLLDLLGILDHFAIARARSQMAGTSLLRARPVPPPASPITNCSEMWACPLKCWGVLRGDRKLIAQVWDGAWRCTFLAGSEREVPIEQCADLVAASRDFYPLRPSGEPNR